MSKKYLGKIESVQFGFVGYQDAMMGLRVSIDMKGSGVTAQITGGWIVERSKDTQWSEKDRIIEHGEMLLKVTEILKQAKVDCVSKLKGIPVECTFEGLELKSWRVLEEVL